MISLDKTYRTVDGHEIEGLAEWFDGYFWGKVMPNKGEQRPPIFTNWHPDGRCRAFNRPEWDLMEIQNDQQRQNLPHP